MKLLLLLLGVTAALAGSLQDQVALAALPRYGPEGIDVRDVDGEVNWDLWKNKGYTFAYIKATGGSSYRNPDFSTQHTGATQAGFIRGAYHFANPDTAPGSAEASYFVKHGGGWSADGITLPGALVLEDGCYGISTSEMVSWIRSFSKKYRSLTGRLPAISTTDFDQWWETCTGNTHEFADHPFWYVSNGSSTAPLPGGWSRVTIWQYGESDGTDVDKFNGNAAGLKRFALGR